MPSERGLDRLVTFLDAVVAIAITLLVLPLVDLAAESDVRAGSLLGDHVTALVAFAVSFAVIARLWVSHHALLEHAGAYDPRFLALNLAWAFTIVVLPFATQLSRASRTDPVALAVYIGTLMASSACLTALTWMLAHRDDLRREGDDTRLGASRQLVTFVAFSLALLLGLVVPGVGYWGLLLLAVDGRAAALLERLRVRRA